MHFPKKIDDEDMELCMKEWRLTGLYVTQFEHAPAGAEKGNVMIGHRFGFDDMVDGKCAAREDVAALYTHRGDHYLALVIEGEPA
jgi:hypothetical protein